MSVAIGIASASMAQSSVAMMEAREAKEMACKSYVANFKGSKDVGEMQQYSECVSLLHPQDRSGDIFIGKVIFIAAVISFVCGVVFTPSYMKDDLLDYLMAGLMGLAIGAVFLLALYLFLSGLSLFF